MKYKQIKELKEIAKKVLIETGKHAPQLIMEDNNGETSLIVIPYENDFQKNIQFSLIKGKVMSGDYASVVFIHEAWMVKRSFEDKPITKKPSECDDKIEALILVHKDLHNELEQSFIMPFERKGKRIIWGKEEEATNKETKMSGRVWDMLRG